MRKNIKLFMVFILVPILIFGSSLASFAKQTEELVVSDTIIQDNHEDMVEKSAKDKTEKDDIAKELESEKTNNGNGSGNGGNLGNGNTNNGSNDNMNNGNGNGNDSNNDNNNNNNSTNNNGNGTGNGGNLGNGNTNNGNNDNTNNGNGNGQGGNGNNAEKPTGSVIVYFVDEQEKVIEDSLTLTGKVDKEYTTTSKEITGYILLTTPSNATGVFVEGEPIIVTYVYKELIGTLVIKHINEKGGIIVEDAPLTARVGTPYTTSPRLFDGYRLVKTPENAEGFYSDEVTVVIYEYEEVLGRVIVKHVNKTDNTALGQDTIIGRIGTDYETSPIPINNFVYDNTSSGQTTGTFTVTDIEVVYYYTPVTPVNNGGNNNGENVFDDDDDDYFDYAPSTNLTNQSPTDTILELDDTIIPLAFIEVPMSKEENDKATTDIIVEEEIFEEMELDLIPLGTANQLPKTGEIPAYFFYGMGLLATTLGVKLRRK